jgi:hypothetical protein
LLPEINKRGTNEKPMKAIKFLIYYVGKLMSVGFGNHQTDNPLGLKWRWNYWQKSQDAKNRKISAERRRTEKYL